MAKIFDFTTNPFFLLGISLRTKRNEIGSAHEDALVDQKWPEEVISKAHQALMVPRSRLEAELSWLPATTPSIAKATVSALTDGDFVAAWENLQKLEGLDSANLAADLCCRDGGSDGYVSELLEAYREFDLKSVAAIISENRAISGFPKLDDDMLAPALEALRRVHAKAAIESIRQHDHAGNAMLEVVLEFKDDLDDNVRHLLDDIAKEYDSWSEPHLRKIADDIRAQIEALRKDTTLQSAPSVIKTLLGQWDEISQPMQVIEESKGRDEHRSRAISEELRDLCLWLANEQEEYDQALAISKALQDTFPELPSIALKTAEDVETLEGLAEQAREQKLVAPLTDFLEEVENSFDTLANDLLRNGFAQKADGYAAKLRKALVDCLNATKGTSQADLPWFILRSIAIRLNNDEKAPKASLILMTALVNLQAWPKSDHVVETLRVDHNTIKVNVLMDELSAAQGPDAGLTVIEQLLLLDVGDKREFLLNLRNQIYAAKNSKRNKRIFWGIVAACVVIWIIASVDDKPRSTYTPSYSSSSTTTPTYTPTPAPSAASLEPELAIPPAGTGHALNLAQLKYCLFEEARLDYIKARMSDALVDQYNVRVDDYNLRCSDFRYRVNDMPTAQAGVRAQQSEISRQAQALINKWSGGASSGNPSVQQAAGTKYNLNVHDDAVAVQTRLSVLGFYSGTIDGRWGPGSAAALLAWKRANSYPDNDIWDPLTEGWLMGEGN